MIESLRAEDAALPLLVWALSDALRRLLKLRQAIDGGQPAQSALRSLGIFGKREAAFTHAARRLDGALSMRLLRDTAHLDRMAKGVGGLDGQRRAGCLRRRQRRRKPVGCRRADRPRARGSATPRGLIPA